ncbi:MAG TPA: TIGR03619 family F420-dependent LLM class oxidoreductase [Acidimicrobiales bacterium]|nr:TIGR03619 family F420-dependent LLM class oxidoreductase [Acidimicrobiales bacterium]
MTPPVSIGLNIVWVKPEHLATFARAAEDLGYESLWSGEHVCLPSDDPGWWRRFPGAEALGDAFTEEMVPFTPDSTFLDPMVVLAHLATVTTRVRLGIGIFMLALRDPVLIGKTLASLDVLSGGRIDMAVGLGWDEAEYRFTGNDWHVRGKRMNEAIRALRVLFDEEHPAFHGELFDFGPLGFEPKPVQRPFPIHIGGGGPPAMRRAGALGNGWYGTPTAIPQVNEERRKAGRAEEPFEFTSLTTAGGVPPGELETLAAMGVHRVVVTPWPGRKVAEVGLEGIEEIEQYAREVGLGG